jgi:hypothetical protein
MEVASATIMTAQHSNNTMTELLREAIVAAEASDNRRALSLLGALVKRDPQNDEAWLWLARIMPEPDRRRYCLERVLSINPAHVEARRMLDTLTPVSAPVAPVAPVAASPVAEAPALTAAPVATPQPPAEEDAIPRTERGSSPLNARIAAAETRRASQPRIIRETDPQVKLAAAPDLAEVSKPAPPKRKQSSEPFIMLRPVALSDVPPAPAPVPAQPAAEKPRHKSNPQLEASAAQLLAAISGEAQPAERHVSDSLRNRLLQAPAPDEALSGIPARPARISSTITIPQQGGMRRTHNLGALLLIGMLGFVLFAAFFALAAIPSA